MMVNNQNVIEEGDKIVKYIFWLITKQVNSDIGKLISVIL